MQRVMGYPLTLENLDFGIFFGHKRPITSKSKEVMYMMITLPEAKSFLILSCPLFSFENGYLFKTFIFDHNVRYDNSVTFRIGVV